MHLFNIMSGRWDGRKSNLVSIRSILLTQEAEKEKSKKSKKEKKVTIHCFLNSCIIDCPLSIAILLMR